ncbi:carbon-nitrogen hydrolase family protein [bacterium]|nr:carbon-nitrogen hydrolase family protein [bacterium]
MSMRKREEIQKVLRGLAPYPEDSLIEKNLVRLAGIQCRASDSRKANLDRYLQFTQTALERGAKLVVFPECFSLPWFHTMDKENFLEMAETVTGPSTEPFLNLAQKYKTFFICPILEVYQKHYYFTSVVIGPDGIMGVYRKIQPADTEYWEERQYVEAGDELSVFDFGFTKVGILMGWDVFFPEAVRMLSLKGADLIIAPTAAAMISHSRWLNVLIGHAVCNNCWVMRVNRCGKERELQFYGESFCVDPFGKLNEQPTFHKDALMIVDVDFADVELARREFPFQKERRIDLYTPFFNTSDSER